MTYDGILLAGGAGRRLGGVSKPSLLVGGSRLIDIGVRALQEAQTIIAAGPTIATERDVVWTRETPVGGGPVAGLAAALSLTSASVVVVLAADLPFVTADSVAELLAAQQTQQAVAVLALDSDSHEQPLLGCYDTQALKAALPDEPAGTAMRALLERVRSIGQIQSITLSGDPSPTSDCDTATDLRRARELA